MIFMNCVFYYYNLLNFVNIEIFIKNIVGLIFLVEMGCGKGRGELGCL